MSFDPRRDLCGIVASLHTPFDEAGGLDEASLVRLVDHAAAAGCSGVLAAAVAGEVGALFPDERRRMLHLLGEATAGRLVLVAGVSAPELETSLSLAREAREAGAATILWQPPPGLDEAALETALERLGEAGPGPVMLQDLDWHGTGLDVMVLARLAERVQALKAVKVETAPAGPKYTAVREATGERLHLSGGWAAMQMPDGLARGLDAFIPSGLLPVYARIWALWQEGRVEEAIRLFERCLPILAFSNQHIEVSIRFWKRVRRQEGLFATDHCRPPIPPLDAVQDRQARSLARRAAELDREMLGSGP